MQLAFLQKCFFFVKKEHLEIFPDCQNMVWALYYIRIVVEVTINMAEYILVVVNFEPIIRGLSNDNFDWDQL